MQEEVTQKTVTFCVRTTKMTADVLKKVIAAYLRHQKQNLIILHGRLQSQDGFHPSNIKMNRLIRKNGEPPQGQHRHFSGVNGFVHHKTSSLEC